MKRQTRRISDESLKDQIASVDFSKPSSQKNDDRQAQDGGSPSESADVNINFVDSTEDSPHGGHHHRKKSRHKRKLTKKEKLRRRLIIIIAILLFIIIALLAAFLIIRHFGKALLFPTNLDLTLPDGIDASLLDNGMIIEYNGKTYMFNTDVTSVLFLGVDQEEFGTQAYGSAGQSDAIYLLAYDTATGEANFISIPRDSMVDVDIYTSSGNYTGTVYEQICLAYAYGDGQDESCENVITSVSRLIYGIPISSYFAVDLSAVAPINDSIGGVTLTVIEDIPGFEEGETVTLMGADAMTYIRYRDTTVLTSNLNRLERQKQYIYAFVEKLIPSVKNDISVVLDLYNTALDYTVTNINAAKITYLATTFARSSVEEINIETVEGETIMGEYYAEFYPDETALFELMLEVYYNEI